MEEAEIMTIEELFHFQTICSPERADIGKAIKVEYDTEDVDEKEADDIIEV